MLGSILMSLPFYHERKVNMTYLNKKIGRHFCIRFTDDDYDIAVPMLLISIMMLLVVICL